MSNEKTCKNCDYMKVKIPVKAKVPVKSSVIIFGKAEAKCSNPDGILNRKNIKHKIGGKPTGHDYVDWKVYGKLCRQYDDTKWI